MPVFLDTRGRTKLAIGICGRCKLKFPYDELVEDPNIPGLWVCADDRDQFDPWRLPARATENISLEHPRPDANIAGVGPTPLYADPILGVHLQFPNTVWAANTVYARGQLMTAQNPNDENITLPIPQFMCVVAGKSGAVPPLWPVNAGVEVGDAAITWICIGIYLG